MKIRVLFRGAALVGFGVAVLATALATTRAALGAAKEPVVQDPRTVFSLLDDRSVWHKVNAKPYYISSTLNVLCAAPTPVRVDEERKRNPHASTAITVFVNEVGQAAMFSEPAVTFPVGSTIVKQKFDPNREPDKPLLYTVMIKREPGFNPDAGDWEFAVISGDGREIQARGALANCIACHTPQKANDFVFRGYVERKR
jgi:hypothetical protein